MLQTGGVRGGGGLGGVTPGVQFIFEAYIFLKFPERIICLLNVSPYYVGSAGRLRQAELDHRVFCGINGPQDLSGEVTEGGGGRSLKAM